ncbi:MAG: DUF808 family protein [Limimaricola sp.]|nr:DUF808 family protein [Limimaricola sp.]
MSGLIALLDDVAAIAKLAAASVDDVVGQATQAGAKAAGAVIDDAAVTPKYIHGLAPARELPIVGKIALGSVRNKLVFLLPAALLLSAFAPWAIAPLLMLGGAYLCYEGAEKVLHWLRPPHAAPAAGAAPPVDPAQLEETKVEGAIKTDFILSAEIMTISLAALSTGSIWLQAGALALAGLFITALVYGGVAIIVKADDVGLWMARNGHFGATRAAGRAVVRAMPAVLRVLTAVGTVAMLWVGGSIILHGLEVLGLPQPAEEIHQLSLAAGQGVGAVEWGVTALCDALAGLVIGAILVPLAGVITPLWAWVSRPLPSSRIEVPDWHAPILLVARLLIAALFLGGALQKGFSPSQVMGLLAGKGLPEWLVWPALVFDAVAALALVLGVGVRPLAFALAAYCGFTSIFHWIPSDPWQITIFVKNWAIAGGCLALAVTGSGGLALRPDRTT